MSSTKGFTLIELLVVLAIIAILAGFAYPSYREYVQRSKRTEAQNILLDIANRQERFYANNNRYAANLGALGFSTPLSSENGYYTISMSVPGSGGAAYTITATATGSQASDARCATITYDALGTKGGTNTDCWGN